MLSSDVHSWSPASQQLYADSVFPYALQANPSLGGLAQAAIWLSENRQQLKQLARQHGGVLFRDFPITSPQDFDAAVVALDIQNFPYRESLSNAVRVNFTPRVFSANEAPSDIKIFLHHEMAQTPLFPAIILFYCQLAAVEGGATPICRSDELYKRALKICPDFLDDLEFRGLKYSNVMPADDDASSGMGRSWRSTLGVDTRAAAEQRLQQLGYSFQWLADECLRATTPALPGIREVSPGRKTLFNQLIAAYSGWRDQRNDPSQAIRHGDDTILDGRAVQQLIELADELSFEVQWQTGDFALIDNTVAMHGRRPFTGPRKVLASLGEKCSHVFQPATL